MLYLQFNSRTDSNFQLNISMPDLKPKTFGKFRSKSNTSASFNLLTNTQAIAGFRPNAKVSYDVSCCQLARNSNSLSQNVYIPTQST